MSGEAQVYVPDRDAAWARASVLRSLGGSKYEVRIDGIDDYEEPRQGTRGAGEIRHVNLEGKEFRGNTGGSGAEKTLPLQNLGMLPHGVDDMTRLNYLHEPAILFNLRRRFFRELPYTYTGEIVIACNPYRWLNLYGEERGRQYAGMVRGDRSRLPPHVYSTSAVAFSGLASKNENQSILVSGESGAGKTETVKILMGHLAVASKALGDSEGEGLGGALDGEKGGRSRGNDGVIPKIIESNPLLESFGNAKTTRNDNSSRFGKFTQLQFDRWFRMAGSECTTYLLEKSRVVGHEPDERGYHIFYQILAAPEDAKAALGLSGKHASDFRYLTADGSERDCVIEGRTDAQRYEMTTAALGLIGVTAEETTALLRALAGIAYLGQVDFRVRDSDEDTSEVVDRATLGPPSELLGFSDDDAGDEGHGAALESSLCYRLIRARNDVVRADSSPAQAAEARDAMAKAVYGCLFDWLVRRINQGTAASPLLSSAGEFAVGDAAGSGLGAYPPPRRRAAAEGPAPGGGTVGLLDIFGFESFQVNRFEQLCINYANEKLQQKFTQDVFKTVQIEYEEEGIPWAHVDFSDNAEVLALVESRMGIIAVLNEECLRPRGNDLSLVNKLVTLHSDHPSFSRAKLARQFEFSVRHYAGEVLYNAEGFLEKNKDSVGQACLDLLAKSRIPLLASVFAPEKAAADGDGGRGGRNQKGGGTPQRKNPKAANTLATKFRDNLTSLMGTIGRTSVQYVRCVKPNAAKIPGFMDNKKVVEQLRCAGVIEAIRISRAAYPNRMSRKEFNKRFALLDKHAARHVRGMGEIPWRGESEPEAEVARCKSLLAQLLPWEGGDDLPLRYDLGRTRVYFRAGALEHLEALRLSERSRKATVLQAVCRMWPRRVYFCALREGTLRAQTEWRRILQRQCFLLDRRRIILVQSCWRRVQAEKAVLTMRRHRAAACLQSYRRMFVARRSFLSMKDAAVRIQTFLRGAQARRAYAVMVVEHREAAKLENQIAALQRKLDEEQQARRKMEKQLARKVEAALGPDDSLAVAPAPPATVTSRFTAETAASAAARAGGDGIVARAGLRLAGEGELMMPRDFLLLERAAEGRLVGGEDGRRGPRLDIMGESSEIIAALKSERDKLRKDNDHLKEANDSLRRERQQEKQRALSSYEASGMSYHALNQNLKALSSRNQKLVAELKQARENSEAEHAAMLEILQTKAEELLRREEEGKTMRLLYESEVTKGKHKLRAMVTMMRLVAETITPMYAPEKDEIGLQLNAIYRECLVEDPVVVGEVDRMMSRPLLDRSSSVFSSAKGMVSNLFGSRKRTSL